MIHLEFQNEDGEELYATSAYTVPRVGEEVSFDHAVYDRARYTEDHNAMMDVMSGTTLVVVSVRNHFRWMPTQEGFAQYAILATKLA